MENKEVCFFGKRGKHPVAYTKDGRLVLCKHEIQPGYAKVAKIEEKGLCLLVEAEHIVKDVYSGIDYRDFLAVLPLHGYTIGFDRGFTNPCWGNEERQIYAYKMETGVVIVAETLTMHGRGWQQMGSIEVYCPQVSVLEQGKPDCVLIGNTEMTVLELTREKYATGLLERIDGLMKSRKSKRWPVNMFPNLWTVADIDNPKRGKSLERLLAAPESLGIFEGCNFLGELKCGDVKD